MTATCELADLHLALRPGADVALFAGLLVHLADRGMAAPELATGLAAALAAARACAPSLAEIAAVADLPGGDVARFYDWFAATERTVTLYSQGVNQSSSGTDKVNAIVNCHLATGRIGRPGMGPLSLTGQPNAMGGREVGGLANQLAAHMGFCAADLDRVRRFWDAPRLTEKPGLKAVDLFDAVLAGNIKALWILGTNPADSMPRAGRVREALAACPFVVVSDCWPTDTTGFADVVLPAAGWGEKDGTVTNSERCISRQRAFRSPPGEARPDWWMLGECARRMGWGRAFRYSGPADIFREHAALSAFENAGARVFDIGALADITDEEYERLRPVQWPLRRGAAPSAGTLRLFGNRSVFPTADGRARFVPTPFRPVAEPVSKEWPLVLNTGRMRDQWHTMTRTGRVPRLATHVGEPLLAIHPRDAERFGLIEGGLARIESRHGAMVLPTRLSMEQRPGDVFVPMHWTDRFSSAGPIGRLVGAATDPISGQPESKATPVRVAPVAAQWSGLLLRRSETMPSGAYYWARVPLDQGHAVTLRGWEALPGGQHGETWVLALLDSAKAAETVAYADPRRGIYRYASLVGDRLDACLFLTPEPDDLPARDDLASLLGSEISAAARIGLLAGTGGGGSAVGDGGPTVCACFAVNLQTLHKTITERRLTSVAEIGAALRAGTNCGSCIPELRAMLRGLQPDAALSAAG
ncbi:MAG TPA: molybdopterin-dependent oxidoreductase [Stellaceae bacterium]|nr:molybdopterin-dependent oxidoreductase [Stellaceae bacterium]